MSRLLVLSLAIVLSWTLVSSERKLAENEQPETSDKTSSNNAGMAYQSTPNSTIANTTISAAPTNETSGAPVANATTSATPTNITTMEPGNMTTITPSSAPALRFYAITTALCLLPLWISS